MKKIMFVCHGNICRSPMAEFIARYEAEKKNVPIAFSSAAVSDEEIIGSVGNPVYPPARATLIKHGIPITEKHAVLLKASDYNLYDLFIIMDSGNFRDCLEIFGSDNKNKIHKLTEFSSGVLDAELMRRRSDNNSEDDISLYLPKISAPDVSDPWYTRDFEKAFNDIYLGCVGLVAFLEKFC